mmetsp:Transcript_95698/g.275763  ORF Transcript_95698/g.275763 Transcript_95698/m.275763 type:complete len:106 (-) Transcript_95698:1495-1812(-)
MDEAACNFVGRCKPAKIEGKSQPSLANRATWEQGPCDGQCVGRFHVTAMRLGAGRGRPGGRRSGAFGAGGAAALLAALLAPTAPSTRGDGMLGAPSPDAPGLLPA